MPNQKHLYDSKQDASLGCGLLLETKQDIIGDVILGFGETMIDIFHHFQSTNQETG